MAKILSYKSLGLWLARVSGTTAYYWFAKGWDYLLFTAAYAAYELKGVLVMAILSLILDIVSVKAYNAAGNDIFGLEAAKNGIGQAKVALGTKRLVNFIPLFVRTLIVWSSNTIVFVVISFASNPFVCTAYFKDKQGSKLTKRDWSLFTASAVLSYAFWIALIHFAFDLYERFGEDMLGTTIDLVRKFFT